MVDTEEFAQLAPNLSSFRRSQILPPLQKALAKFDIVTRLREAHAMAQFLHESGSFIYKEEIASGAAYEGRVDLGNTQPGDGRRYKGRGWIQVTGRFNYRKYGKVLGIDLEGNPQLAGEDEYAALIACAYWGDRKLNDYADRDDINTITRRINGGLNGLADRRSKLVLAKRVLSADEPPAPDPEEPFRVTLHGVTISHEAFLDESNHLWVPLRAMTTALGATIVETQGDDATLETKSGTIELPLVIRGTTGFSPAKELASKFGLSVNFKGKDRLLELD